ncbi:MAG: hypothetical protein JXR73_07755 [Candidatus Omnitrophica bacterium]|nr:hypothetical protein [Candidatus Omnitrophota bacterium]
MDGNKFLRLFQRLNVLCNRYGWTTHLLMAGLSIFLFWGLINFRIPFLTEILMSVMIGLELLLFRVSQTYLPYAPTYIAYFMAGLLILLPQILLWMFRKRKCAVMGLMLAIIVANGFITYANFAYSRWSANQVGKYYGQTVLKDAFFQNCGTPLCYSSHQSQTIIHYSDGYFIYRINLTEDEDLQVSMPGMLND